MVQYLHFRILEFPLMIEATHTHLQISGILNIYCALLIWNDGNRLLVTFKNNAAVAQQKKTSYLQNLLLDYWSLLTFTLTLWLFNIAMEHGPFIDGLPIENGDFPWLC